MSESHKLLKISLKPKYKNMTTGDAKIICGTSRGAPTEHMSKIDSKYLAIIRGFKIGIKVRVIRKHTPEENYTCSWMRDMDSTIGNVYTITDVDKAGTIELSNNWRYMTTVLEKVEE